MLLNLFKHVCMYGEHHGLTFFVLRHTAGIVKNSSWFNETKPIQAYTCDHVIYGVV